MFNKKFLVIQLTATWCLCCISLLSTANESIHIELLLFNQQNIENAESYLKYNPMPLPSMCTNITNATTISNPKTLVNEARKLQDHNYKLLNHFSWDLNNLKGQYLCLYDDPIEGSIQIKKQGQQYHTKIDLRYKKGTTNFWQIKQQITTHLKEIYYLDHPKFGGLLVISKNISETSS